jgi:hypothetical protein
LAAAKENTLGPLVRANNKARHRKLGHLADQLRRIPTVLYAKVDGISARGMSDHGPLDLRNSMLLDALALQNNAGCIVVNYVRVALAGRVSSLTADGLHTLSIAPHALGRWFQQHDEDTLDGLSRAAMEADLAAYGLSRCLMPNEQRVALPFGDEALLARLVINPSDSSANGAITSYFAGSTWVHRSEMREGDLKQLEIARRIAVAVEALQWLLPDPSGVGVWRGPSKQLMAACRAAGLDEIGPGEPLDEHYITLLETDAQTDRVGHC